MTDDIIRKLASRVLRAEVAVRRPRDVGTVIDAIATRIRFDNNGDIFIVDREGQRDNSKTFDSFMVEVQEVRPELFQQQGSPKTEGNVNPFRNGVGFSITKQMLLINTNPELASQYEAEAND